MKRKTMKKLKKAHTKLFKAAEFLDDVLCNHVLEVGDKDKMGDICHSLDDMIIDLGELINDVD